MVKTRIVMIVGMLLVALFIAGAQAGPFDQIVIFGDSLSDNGNLVFFDEQPEPDPAIYWEGRFSNGPVWIEYLAGPEGLDAPLKNWAFGGAETSGVVPPGLLEQVLLHVLDENPPFSPNTLFVIWIGGNDYLNSDRDAPYVVENIEAAMDDLVEYGARHLLVLNMPDLGAIPDNLDTPEAAAATAFTHDFNAQLGNMLDRFSSLNPAVAVYEFDIYGLSVAVAADPEAFGFVNATAPSPNFVVPNEFDDAGHVFWDEKHPTTAMHAIVADQALAALNEQIDGSQDSTVGGSNGSSTCFIRTAGWGI
jgi:thermolabile hemolysin